MYPPSPLEARLFSMIICTFTRKRLQCSLIYFLSSVCFGLIPQRLSFAPIQTLFFLNVLYSDLRYPLCCTLYCKILNISPGLVDIFITHFLGGLYLGTIFDIFEVVLSCEISSRFFSFFTKTIWKSC